MTDPHQSDDDAVRRLLAEARHDEPIPADVATRLDDVISGLVDERDGLASLAARRRDHRGGRRRRLGAGLVAAAAVVLAVGVGVPRIVGSVGSADDSRASGAADTSADSAAAGSTSGGASDEGAGDNASGDLAPEAAPASPPPSGAPEPTETTRQQYDAAGAAALTSAHFEADVRRLVARLASGASPGAASIAGPGCPAQARGPGQSVPVTYDGRPATLLLRPAEDGVRTVDLVACGTGEVIRSTQVPVA